MKKLIKLIIITVLVVFCVFRFDKIYACGTWIIGLLMPFVIGFAIAFILNVRIFSANAGRKIPVAVETAFF